MSVAAAEIDKAIAAHAMWKTRLKNAINTGTMETPVSTVQVDNACDFGKWLYKLTDKSADFNTVKALHAQFHKAAASVAQFATSGKKAEAEALLSMNGEFANVSSKLTTAMMAWKKTL